MRWLYNFDMEAFRAIHVDLHRDWLTPFFWLLSYSGLGQVQAILLIVILFWRRKSSRNLITVVVGFIALFATAPLELMEVQGPAKLALTVLRVVGAVTVIYGAIRELNDRENPLRYYVVPFFTTLIIAGIPVAQGMKRLIPRDRPSNLYFANPQEEFLARSFPSGHSTTAFAVAFMLWLLTRKKEHAWLGHAALIWAVLVGISRIYRGVHWPTDVIAGAFAGLFSSALVYLVLGMLGHLDHLEATEASSAGEAVE